jgi:glycine cleavage system T protein (aminomethyltransferase)
VILHQRLGVRSGDWLRYSGACPVHRNRHKIKLLAGSRWQSPLRAHTIRVSPRILVLALRTPLYDWHVANGGRLVEFAGWDMPVQYTTITQEHETVRHAAGLFDISHMGRLTFEGAGAVALLERLFTNEVATMKPGQVRYGLICNEAGGILDDVLVYRLAPYWMMVVNASNREKILRWIGRHLDDVVLTDRTQTWAMIAIQGPLALDVTANAVPDPGRLKYYTAEIISAHAQPTILSRTGYTGEDGFEIIVPSEQVRGLVERLISAGKGRMKPCGLGARDTLRLEAAMPLYGHELAEDIDPLQAGLGWAVKLQKGDFMGREAIIERSKNPELWRRVGVELEGKRIAREGAAILLDGRQVGKVTSGTYSPTLSKAIAMGYVAPAYTGTGTRLEVDVRGKTESARVVEMPFYRRKK